MLNAKESDYVHAFYKKSSEWQGEREWRILEVLQTMPPFTPNFDLNSKLQIEGGVAGVIFGIATPAGVIDTIRQRLQEAASSTALKRVVHDPVTFQRSLEELV
jgi:hypothetical protein